MRTLNVERMRRYAQHRYMTEQVTPADLLLGDRVLVECEVVQRRHYGNPKNEHVIVRPVGAWRAGDQHLWTYGWPQATPVVVERVKS